MPSSSAGVGRALARERAACAAGVRRSRSEDVLAACAVLGLPPGAVMLVSDQARALGAARGARALSCYMRKQLASAPQRVPRRCSERR